MPVLIMKESLSFFENLKSPNAWSVFFRSSPKMWSTADGEAVLKVLRLAKADPVKRPLDKRKMRPPPRPVKSKLGAVTVPENDTTKASKQKAGTSDKPKSEERAHTEIQYLLLKLGSGMGFDVWVARNDRGCSYKGIKFADMPRIKDDLPSQFDEATNRTIALIDVLWLKENTYVAAFEVESTTSIYSGLLRMADLVAMQPNIKIPLYLLAPGNRRGKVFAEVNRPTFSRLKPPLVDICSYISFESLREEYQHVQEYLSFLRPEFLEKISERCLLE
ncbi:MAG: hypothetical protein QNK37_07255 [Acidobacteriota bacterium]|nr:hypothetical protein [Acidobacteriota bacterium]